MKKLNCKVKLTNGHVVGIKCENFEFKNKIAAFETKIPFDNLLIVDCENEPFSSGKEYSSNNTFHVYDLGKFLKQFTKLKIIINQYDQNKQLIEAEISTKFRKYKDVESEFEKMRLDIDSLTHENADLKKRLQTLNEKYKTKTQEQIQSWQKQQQGHEIQQENLKQIQEILNLDKEQLKQKLKETFKKLLESHIMILSQEKRMVEYVTQLSTVEHELVKCQADLQNSQKQLQEIQKKNQELEDEKNNWLSNILKFVGDIDKQ